MVSNDYLQLQYYLDRYFSSFSQEDLNQKVFPENPELYNAIAKYREYGVPANYKKAVKSFPVNQKMVFFESNLGKQYTGNPRYIYERMLELYPDYTYVWCYMGREKIPGNPMIVKRGTTEYYTLLAQSKYLVNNTTFPLWYHRSESFYLQTWHGTPFKRLHWDRINRPMNKRSKPDFYTKSTMWDTLLSPNSYSTRIFRSAFKYKGNILESGYPANDIFYQQGSYQKKRQQMRNKIGVNNDKTPVYLYAPTWRDGTHMGNAMFKFDLMLDVNEFIKKAPKNSILLIRSHHMSSSDEELAGLSGRVIDVSTFDDAIELMCAADVLITDYSSIVFDWYCSKKPVVYYVPDYEEYVNSLRGSYFELEEHHAGPICRTQDELYKNLNIITDQNKKEFNIAFYQKFCGDHDGQSADRVIDYLLKN